MNVIYIIGPFRGKSHWDVECNIRRAEEVALILWRKGFAVICPHTNTRFFDGAAEDHVWLDGDKEILRRCDAAICIDGWMDSSGSCAEVLFAKMHGVRVFVSITEMIDYFSGSNKVFTYAWSKL